MADPDRLPTLEAALRAVRREALKAGLVYAIVDAAITATVVILLLATFDVAAVPETIAVPVAPAVADGLEPLLGPTGGRVWLGGAVAIGFGVAALGFVVEMMVIARRDSIRWFERANPDLGAALRTARDAAAAGAEDVMADRLYAEVLDRLQGSSGVALLNRRSLAARLGLVVLFLLGAGGTIALGISVDLPGIGDGGDSPTGRPPPGDGVGPPIDGDGDTDDDGLGPGRDILGDPVDVPRGEIPDDVVVDPGGSSGESDRPYETGGFPSGSVAVEAEAAGFAPPAVLEDRDLVREYSVAIRTGNVTGGNDG